MNDILKEFKIVFGLDDKPLQDGIKNTESSLKNLANTFAKITATYFSFQAISGIINGFNDFNKTLDNNTMLLGYNAEYVANYGNALKRFGGDTNSVISTLNNLNQHLQDVKFGSGALIEVAKKYGIAFTNSNGSLMKAEDLLSSLSNQLQKYDKQTRFSIASQLGLDESIQRAFVDGGKELNQFIKKQKELGLVTSDDLKISTEFNRVMLDFKDIFTYLSRLLARTFLPVLTNIVKGIISFVEFLKRHKEFVKIFFVGMLLAITPILLSLTKMALASSKAFAPFIKGAAIIAGLALIIEDIYGYFKGWDTVTGDLVKKFPALGEALEFIRPLVLGIEQAFKSVVAWLKDPTWSKFLQIFVDLGNAVIDTFQKPLEYVLEIIKNIIGIAQDWIGGVFGKISSMSNNFLSNIPFLSGNNAITNNNTNNNVTINQNISGNNANQIANSSNKMIYDTLKVGLQR